MSIESNCFRIDGLSRLHAEYRLFQIAGLRRETPEYYPNVQRLIRQLSYQMKAPVTTYDKEGETFLVVPEGFGDPPDHVTLVGAVAALKDTGETIELDFERPCSELDPVRLRFLQFCFKIRFGKTQGFGNRAQESRSFSKSQRSNSVVWIFMKALP